APVGADRIPSEHGGPVAAGAESDAAGKVAAFRQLGHGVGRRPDRERAMPTDEECGSRRRQEGWRLMHGHRECLGAGGADAVAGADAEVVHATGVAPGQAAEHTTGAELDAEREPASLSDGRCWKPMRQEQVLVVRVGSESCSWGSEA